MRESLLNTDELLKAVNGFKVGNVEAIFYSVETDSRNVTPEKVCMFVPLVGEFQDGHKYIEQSVVEKKASVVLMNKTEYENNSEKYDNLAKENSVCLICVDNTLHALQKAAEAYVEKVAGNMIRVSITGSCGKTTTKEMLVSVCKKYYGEDSVAYTKGNFNSETGLPLSVFKIRGDEKIGIFEMGMNRENEIGEISAVLKSKYGIITNIGNAHIGILGSRENIAREKRKSFNYIPADGCAFIPEDDDFADFCTADVKGKVVRFGKTVDSKVNGVEFIKDNGLYGTSFALKGVIINLPLSGSYNYQNALGVAALCCELGIPAEDIKFGLENVAAVTGRMEIKKGVLKNNAEITVVKDCYNANPDSMKKSLEFISGVSEVGKKVVILADMKELGAESEKAHREIGKILSEIKPAKAILIGFDMKLCLDEIKKAGFDFAEYYAESSENSFNKIAAVINEFCEENDLVLLKGSNSMKLADIIPLMLKEENK